MTRLLLLVALLLVRRLAVDLRRLWWLYTADRAPLFPTADDYLPRHFTEVYR